MLLQLPVLLVERHNSEQLLTRGGGAYLHITRMSAAELGPLGAINVDDPIIGALSKLATDKPKSVLSVGG